MLKLTLKDFIAYNYPCFSCKSKVNLTLEIINNKTSVVSSIKPHPAGENIEFPLRMGYNNRLSLIINPQSNKLTIKNKAALIDYLSTKKLFFYSLCKKCDTRITTNILNVDFDFSIVKPIEINTEQLVIKHGKFQYQLINNFKDNVGMFYWSENEKLYSFNYIKGAVLPLHKIKNKNDLIKKFKTYILFS